MFRFVSASCAVAAFSLAAPLAVSAVPIVGHTAAKVIKQGTTTKPTVVGTVELQVLVPATGRAKVQRILKSSNHANDAAAIEIANGSTYSPAINDGKPDTEFYDFQLKFTSNGVAAAPAGSLASYEALLHESKFADAKTGLTTYLAAHPNDTKAQLDLGLVDTFLGTTDEAAAIFVKADPIPASMKSAAFKSLYESSVADVKAKKTDEAMLYAKKAAEVSPTYLAYAQIGSVSLATNDYAGAATAYEMSKAAAASATPAERATIDGQLVLAYLGADMPDKARAAADEAKSLDPSRNSAVAFGQYYADQAHAKDTAGDSAGAAALYEQGAVADPSDAVTLYTDAAFAYLKMKSGDFAKAKADADKALAIDPTDPGANFAAGVAVANLGHPNDAIPFLNKADAAAKAKGLTALATQIESNLKAVSGTK